MKLTTFDAADYLDSEDEVAAYLDAALELGDPAVIAKAMGDIARARGMTAVSRSSGINRETLYRAFSASGNPEMGTFFRLANALGLRLCVRDVGHARRRASQRAARGARVKPTTFSPGKKRQPARRRTRD